MSELRAPMETPVSRGARVALRGRLFRKYLVLILVLVGGAVLISGAISVYFSYQENKTAIGALQHEKALAAATRIQQYVERIQQQLAYASLPQIDATDVELRRIEFNKLLRQVPDITDIAQLDPEGREQIAVSRLAMDRIGSNDDRSKEPAFLNAKRGQPWFGPVYFRKETEPYMTIALRSSGDKGPVTIADVNLKFMQDVVSRIKIGEEGKAYIVDNQGFLVADPDIGLVLRKTNLANLRHVKSAAGPVDGDEAAMLSVNLAGTEVLSAFAKVDPLGWTVFVEQPVTEVYEKLNASIVRAGLLLLGALVISALGAAALARGMVRPIRTLDEGARRIGDGELDQQIVVRTGDELEGLADQFNRMTAQLRESYAGLEHKVEERTKELTISLEQQTAISEILRVISSSPTDVQPVLDAIAERAARLCDASAASMYLTDGDMLRHLASKGPSPDPVSAAEALPINRESISGRALLERKTLQVEDMLAEGAEYPISYELAKQQGHRTVAVIPLIREGKPFGTILLRRQEVRPFSEREIALLAIFGDQAAIALENVRLFNETKEALDQQRASGEVLTAISNSIADTKPVFDVILQSCQRLFAGDIVGVMLVRDDNLIDVGSYVGVGLDELRKRFPQPLTNATASGRAILERRVVSCPDLDVDEAPPLTRELAKIVGYRAIVAAPMILEGKAIGALWVARTIAGGFNDKQLALLKTFAEQAVIAIQNARLFNETKEALDQQRASGEVLAAISNSIADTTPVFERILESCERLFAGKVGVINLVGDDGLVHLASYHGSHQEELAGIYPFPVDESSATGVAILQRKIIHYTDVDHDPTIPERAMSAWKAMGTKAIIGAPMMWEGKGVGAIFVLRDYAGPFSDKDIALLKTFADQAVIAIQNARLFREIGDKSRQLEIANKHKSEFLANMSHELRTPLNAIIGFSEVLQEKLFGDVNEKQADYLNDIHSSGKHLLGLINDILDLSKVEAGRMELDLSTFDAASALANAMTLVRERAQRHNIALGMNVGPDMGQVTADERKLKQILVNLLTNAVKFTPDGGRVDVSARREPDELVIAVRDTGIGIAKVDQDAVFEEFRQVGRHYTNKQEGTGLGLTLTRRFVELHGGRIWVESEPGKGSTFTFTIPVQQ